MSSAARDALRSKILSDKPKTTTVVLEDGVVVEVRQSTVGAMLDMIQVEDTKQRMASMLIMSCFVPGTGEAIFEAADTDSLMVMPSGGYYQKLVDAINMFNPQKGVDTAKKNSEPSQGSS